MHDDPAQGVRRKKDSTLVRAAEAVRDGNAERDDLGRQHRRDDGGRAPAHGPHQGRQPPGDRHADPGARLAADGAARRRRQRRGPARLAGAVRPDGRGVRPAPLRHRRAAGRAAVDRRGARQGRHAAQGGVRAARRGARHRLHRQRRRSRRDDRRRRRRRHRRVHRQRRAEDARGRHADGRAGAARGVRRRRSSTSRTPKRSCRRCCRCTRRSIPRRTAARSSSASTACASSPTGRRASGRS